MGQTIHYTSGTLDIAHLLITFGLFSVNALVWQMVGKDGFLQRLKYIGQEMVFLSLGIVAARIFVEDTLVVFLSMFIYLVVWALTVYLTKQVIDYKATLYPQLVVTILLGLLSAYLSASGYIEHALGVLVTEK